MALWHGILRSKSRQGEVSVVDEGVRPQRSQIIPRVGYLVFDLGRRRLLEMRRDLDTEGVPESCDEILEFERSVLALSGEESIGVNLQKGPHPVVKLLWPSGNERGQQENFAKTARRGAHTTCLRARAASDARR